MQNVAEIKKIKKNFNNNRWWLEDTSFWKSQTELSALMCGHQLLGHWTWVHEIFYRTAQPLGTHPLVNLVEDNSCSRGIEHGNLSQQPNKRPHEHISKCNNEVKICQESLSEGRSLHLLSSSVQRTLANFHIQQ